jgi:hypothetical protein
MAVTLLALPNGHYSLEFETSNLPSVIAAIHERYGVPGKRRYPILAVYSFGGCDFTFQNEWDDPCLVAGSEEGSEILKALHAILGGV